MSLHQDRRSLEGAALRSASGAPATSPDGKPLPATGPVQYKAIGTNIDCIVHIQDDGRYRLEITIEDSSVYASDKPVAGTMASSTTPVFRSFKLTNAVIFKDGQTSQFTAATDKITGEVVKVDVTLNVVKYVALRVGRLVGLRTRPPTSRTIRLPRHSHEESTSTTA